MFALANGKTCWVDKQENCNDKQCYDLLGKVPKISATTRLVVRIPIWSTLRRIVSKSIGGTKSTAMLILTLNRASCFITLEDQQNQELTKTVSLLQRQ